MFNFFRICCSHRKHLNNSDEIDGNSINLGYFNSNFDAGEFNNNTNTSLSKSSTLVCEARTVIPARKGAIQPIKTISGSIIPGTSKRTCGSGSSAGARSPSYSECNSLGSIESIGKINMEFNTMFGSERFSDMSEVIFKRSLEKNINVVTSNVSLDQQP